ncbi:molybdopterin-dependent oxidoreductase [Azohydromonas lata]|uniref:Molybdopterin-dependent oxidoreductase n=1 Tax=Azohydromonas lata TaxID=45677 RepID=A0ABU5IIT3_9BURK|nr:molybdopterin-dependent oxidoreductase [Azohydromonas lata]MDZ5457983.1 molybdopterin-dependent oxidoreductase [Azohydromonas lata]
MTAAPPRYTSTHWGVYRPVVDGARLRALEPAPWDPDPSPLAQSLVQGVDAAVRVRRPAARASWLEAARRGEAAAATRRRGDEPFVEIEWDEALDLAATELQRVRRTHGNAAIYGGSYGWSSAGRFHHAQSQLHRFLNGLGGYTASVDTYSLGAGRVLMPHVVADMDTLLAQHTSWDEIARHGSLFVAFGGLPLRNAQVSPGGAGEHQLRGALQRLRAAGVRFINVSPLRSDLEGVDAQWLPMRPGGDAALMLALAQVWLTEGLHDRAFLDSHCMGFEAFARHLCGEDDGVPKTPAWAEARTDVPANTIVALARRMAAQRTLINCAYALQRARHGEQPFWLTVVLAAMLGQVGLPGGGFGLGYGCMNNTGSGRAPFSGPRLPQGSNAVQAFIPVARLADMLLHPGERFHYNGRSLRYPDIRLVYWAGGNPFHHHQQLGRLRRAWQRPETIVVQDPFWTSTARHADLVLPATTALEREDIGSAASDRWMVAMRAAMPPVGQARDDHAIFAALAARLGFEAKFTEGRTPRQWLEHLYDASRERAQAHGLALPPFEQFWSDGLVELPRPARPVVLLSDFRADPVNCPLPTPSGRIEITSATIANYAGGGGHPRWHEPEASPWPLQLLSCQPATRLHSQYDHGAVSQASKIQGREPLTISPRDAAARGITDGDLVRVWNEHGAFLAGARVSGDIRPGVLQIATGAWFDPWDDAPGADSVLCRHGNPNTVTPDVGSSALSQGCSAQTARVDVERWTGPVPRLRVMEPPLGVAAVP